MAYATLDELNTALGKCLAESSYLDTYKTESAFERDGWAPQHSFNETMMAIVAL